MANFLPEILAVQFSNGSLSESLSAGNLVTPSPRRASRGRNGEILLTALDLHARTQLPAAELNRLSALMAQVYFETPGSVTAALRAAFVAANAEVLPFSQAATPIGPMAGGVVQLHALCAVLREGDLYFGFAGDVLALILRENIVESYPPTGDSPSRALGTMLNVDLRYGHSSITGVTTVILAASPAPGWSAAVPSGLANLSLRAIAERMAQQNATRPGSFGSLLLRLSPEPVPAKSAAAARKFPFLPQRQKPKDAIPSAPVKIPARFVLHAQAKESEEKQSAVDAIPPAAESVSKASKSSRLEVSPSAFISGMKPSSMAASPTDLKFSERRNGSAGSPQGPGAESLSAIPGPAISARPHSPAAVKPAAGKPSLSWREAVSAFGHSLRVTLVAALDSVRSFLAGILPRGVLQENDRLTLPPWVLLGTAVAIPLVVVAVVAVLYFRQGYAMEFSRLMQEARTQASVASVQTDPLQARAAWQKTFDLLKSAARYGSSDELTSLQNHAARMLDDFDGISPLEFYPAVAGGLEADARITAILAGDREIYALDSTQDRVLRLLLGQGGYQLDDTFLCQAGQYPDITVDSLADIVWVPDLSVGSQTPSSAHGGAVVAMDGKGTLLYCPPGGKAMAGALTAPRDEWATPASMDYYNGKLYVLDPGRNGFWRFGMSGSAGFDQSPTDYFATDHPSLADVVDFVVASGEVFFLHADGRVTRCQYDPLYQSAGGDSTGGQLCEDILFNDTRPGRTAGSQIRDALLSRMYYNEPPEPTLFFLDPLGRGAYRFSMALNFISRYRVTIAPEQREATALAVGTDKVLYIAIGNQIYYAQTRTP
jgi:nucleoid-associated protein YgaU